MSDLAGPVRPAPGGCRLRVRVLPRASRTELAGLHGDALRVRLAAAPVDGAANDALIRFLSDALDLPRARLTLVAGHSSRSKTVQVDGLSAIEAAARLGVPPPADR